MAGKIDTPDQAPDPDGGHDLKSSFDVLITSIPALKSSIDKQSRIMEAQLDLQTRMAAPGAGRAEAMGHIGGVMAQYRPRMREEVLQHLTATGGVPADVTMGITKMTRTGALTSIQNLHAYGAQRLGEMIAGEPLYNPEKGREQPDTRPAGTTTRRRPRGMAQAIRQGAAAAPAEAPDVLSQAPAQAPPAGQGAGAGTAAALAAAVVEAATKGAVEGEQQKLPMLRAMLGKPQPEAPPSPSGQPPVSGAGPAAQAGPGGGAPPGGPAGPGGGGAPGGGAAPVPGGQPAGGATGAAASWRQNLGARVAMSGGTPGGVLGMLRKVPLIGLGVDIAEKGADVYTSQREAGRVFQETEGGQNLGAQVERAHSFAYQASMFGRVPNGVAAQMFGQATALGFSQRAVGQGQQLQNRQSALNFMYHQYTGTGTSVEQSAEILQTASQNATVSLKSVGDAMTSLSDVAGKAGTSAKGARDNFNDLLNTAISVGAAGGAPQLAGGQATTQASYGRAFAGTSFAGLNAPGMQYMIAGQAGLSPAQVQQAMRTNPAAYNKMLAGSEAQFISQLPGMTPEMTADLKSMVAAAGGTSAIKQNPDLVASISTQFLNKYQIPANIDLNVWASVLSQLTGVKLTPGTVMAYVVENVGGNTVASNSGVGAAGGEKGGGGAGTGAPVAAGHMAGAASGKFGLAKPLGETGVLGTIAHAARNAIPFGLGRFLPGDKHGGKTWQQVLQGGPSGPGAAGTYLGAEKKSGKRSPVLEALLQNVPKGAQVAVQTASGTRVLSFEDAMKQFPNEMEAGNVQFYDSGGKNLGSTSTLTQGLVDPTANVTAETASKTHAGVSLSQWQKKHPQAGGSGVSATLDLTSEAKQLLKLLPSNSDNAAAAATAPANPLPSSSSR